MIVQGTNAKCFRASVLVEIAGITIEEAKGLKAGDAIDVSDDVAKSLIDVDAAKYVAKNGDSEDGE